MQTLKIAVLIDGDNAEASLIEQVLNEAGKYGKLTIKRIYADWTQPNMSSWKECLNTYAIRPIQKFSYSKQKNSTDTALIIDAMDILHAKLVDGFCIVSSDSDYTGIAHRVREEGLYIMGIGKGHTPEAFVKACENFVYTEILVPTEKDKKTTQKQQISSKIEGKENKTDTETTKETTPIRDTHKLPGLTVIGKIDLSKITNKVTNKPINIETIDKAFDIIADEVTGIGLASKLGEAIRRIDPTFDVRNFGFKSFRAFLETLKDNYELIFHKDKTTISLKRIEK